MACGQNTVIHRVQGNWVDAGMSFVAILPLYGDAIKATYNAGKAGGATGKGSGLNSMERQEKGQVSIQ